MVRGFHPGRSGRTLTAHQRHLVVPLAVFVAFLVGLGFAHPAAAHAELDTSSPEAGAVIAQSPTEIVATFTEPLERSYSRLQLFDSQGVLVEETTLVEGDDEFTMALKVATSLPNGTYSVLWRTQSAADGHSAQNYFAFTVGTNADIVSVVVPDTVTTDDPAAQWLQTASRGVAYLGVTLLIGIWIFWSHIVRSSVGESWRDAPGLVRRIRTYTRIAIVIAIAGSLFALLVQAQSIETGSQLDKVLDTLGQTRYGRLWLIRAGLIAVEAVLLFACGWWYMRRRQVEGWLAMAVAAMIPIPFSLIAHASAAPTGRIVAIAADAVHLLAASVWIGGIFILATVLFPWARRLDSTARRAVLIKAIPRFSMLALIALSAVGITGAYAGWLEVGNLEALRSTDYGKALIIKLALLAIVIAIASVNLFVIERRLQERARIRAATLWSKRLSGTVAVECMIVVLILVAVGQLTSLQPARDQVIERAQQISVTFQGQHNAATMYLAPGIAGVNHFRIEFDGPPLPADTVAVLRMTIPDRQDLGTKEIQLSRVAGNAFAHHGNELSIAATWQFTAILRTPASSQVNLETTTAIGSTAPDVDVPGKPWRFETAGGLTGLAVLLLGIAGLVVGLRSGPGRLRKESGGLGAAALFLGVILLFQARIDPVLSETNGGSAIDPGDVALVERGKQVYATYCLSCHGADLRGDGPAGAGMQPAPADFSQPHTMTHAESDLVYWLRFGKQGTGMPAFGETLSDADMQAVLSYIEYRQQQFGTSPGGATPQAAGCTVAPRTIFQIQALAGSGATDPDPNGPLPLATDSAVDAQTTSTIQAMTTQLIACTNGLDTMRRLALFSDDYLRIAFATGLPPGFADAAVQPPTPLPTDAQVSLVEMQRPVHLVDGRIAATVVVTDPGGQFAAAGKGSGGTNPNATIIFRQVEGSWLIDEIRAA